MAFGPSRRTAFAHRVTDLPDTPGKTAASDFVILPALKYSMILISNSSFALKSSPFWALLCGPLKIRVTKSLLNKEGDRIAEYLETVVLTRLAY
jgi:hypothetical protein